MKRLVCLFGLGLVLAGCQMSAGVSSQTARQQKDIENRVNKEQIAKGNLPPGDGPSN